MSTPERAARRRELSVEEYLAAVLATVQPLPERAVALRRAYGCVAARKLRAKVDLPPFTSSAMDGYAVRSGDLAAASAGSPVRLRVTGEVAMGAPAASGVAPGCAVEVPTGGLLPEEADAVVPVEETIRVGDGAVFTRPVAAGRNVRPAGEDLERGEVLVGAGCRLEAADVAALAAGGYSFVPVVPQPVVAVLSTGDELVGAGEQPAAGQIFESNSFLMEGLVRRAGGEPFYGGRVPDNPTEVAETCRRLAGRADLVLCTGGVSAGRNDPVRRAFEAAGPVEFVRVAAQPGRPQACGTVSGKPFLGLPGNPMAALVSFLLFGAPAISKLAGRPAEPGWLPATCAGDAPASPAATRFVPAGLSYSRGGLVARPLARRRSNQLGALARAAGMVEIPPGTPLEAGSACRVLPFRDL